jgi:hypothetical protein
MKSNNIPLVFFNDRSWISKPANLSFALRTFFWEDSDSDVQYVVKLSGIQSMTVISIQGFTELNYQKWGSSKSVACGPGKKSKPIRMVILLLIIHIWFKFVYYRVFCRRNGVIFLSALFATISYLHFLLVVLEPTVFS